MIRNCIPSCLFGILACFVAGTVARVALLNGYKAGVDQFPYQISLQIEGQGHECGGGILGDHFIITAAHCVIKNNGHFNGAPMTIIAGTNDLRRTIYPAVEVHVKKIFVPSEYNPKDINSAGDIAILMLLEPLKLSEHKHLRKLHLPSKHEEFEGKTADISGFGWDHVEIKNEHPHGSNKDTQLRFAEVDILHHCDKHSQHKIGKAQLCARMRQPDETIPSGACIGDSGGPLVVDSAVVVGILSIGPMDCSEKFTGAIYTRVSHYLDFIEHAKKNQKHPHIREYTP